MGPITRTVGGVSILAVPALILVADELRMAIEPEQTGTLVNTEYGVEWALADLAAIEADRGTFVFSAALSYAAVLLLVPLLLGVWRLSVARSPRWAWASAVLAALGVTGSMVHLTAYHGMSLAALEVDDRTAAAEMLVAAEGVPFVIALFAGFFISLIVWVPQAIGLYRSRVIPLWGAVAVGVGTVAWLAVGSTPWSTPVWAVAVTAGFAPAALAMLRGRVPSEAEPAPAATPAHA
ncbi:hypothetical protein BH20ACT5_BH20ACT5_07470 [soil metagenome]